MKNVMEFLLYKIDLEIKEYPANATLKVQKYELLLMKDAFPLQELPELFILQSKV